MARIGVTCPRCGDGSELQPGDVALHAARSCRYAFTCPHCGELVVKVADEVVTSLLVAVGVVAWVGSPAPWEPTAPASPRSDAPPLTLDDLLELHELLARPDCFEDLVGPTDASGP